ncbi:hypothetical protein BV22DRAFT_1013791 [Leucogyrophana mollusca]|uniref:Uncharacterized protein n=1 Tax=Leucogyrophana mollusca TaxID=85980 RepID=A0ACB8BFQ0_9AGAM|nr:hypothetical protein BV22DRAFT_1013791 [Leucogyrophana mollusca]
MASPSSYHYICFAISPSCSDELKIRKTLHDALTQMFGVTSSTYLDILSITEGGGEVVLRIRELDASRLAAAVVASTASPRFSLIKESPFLPSLLVTGTTL